MIKLDRAICIFDLEATGTNVLEDRIVDICILRREPDGTETVFSSLVNPGVPIPPEATAIHHITDDMVKDQPRGIFKSRSASFSCLRKVASIFGTYICVSTGK